jgi:hypothetical protein
MTKQSTAKTILTARMFAPFSFSALSLSRRLCHPKPYRPVIPREIGRSGDRKRAVGVTNNPITDVRLRVVIVHEPSTAVPPVIPDSGNAVGILIRTIERAVSDPQRFHFAFWSEKLTHRCQARVTYSCRRAAAQRSTSGRNLCLFIFFGGRV